MSKYINLDKLIAHLQDEVKRCEVPLNSRAHGKTLAYGTELGLKMAVAFAQTLSDADSVEVVRCKDCVKKDTSNCAMWYDCEKCKGQWSWCNPNDYCSYGERSKADDDR